MTSFPDRPTPIDASTTQAASPIPTPAPASSENAVATVATQGIQEPQQTALIPLSRKSIQPVYVSTVSNKTNLTALQNGLRLWFEIANKQYAEAQSQRPPSTSDIDKLGDNIIVIEELIESISALKDTESVFVAFDKNANLQAVGIADFSPKKGFKVHYIATHPENIATSTHPARFKGGGAAVMTAIIANAFIRGCQKTNLTLSSYGPAVGFYENLGFTAKPKASPTSVLTPMVIEPQSMATTLQSRLSQITSVPEPENPPQSAPPSSSTTS